MADKGDFPKGLLHVQILHSTAPREVCIIWTLFYFILFLVCKLTATSCHVQGDGNFVNHFLFIVETYRRRKPNMYVI